MVLKVGLHRLGNIEHRLAKNEKWILVENSSII